MPISTREQALLWVRDCIVVIKGKSSNKYDYEHIYILGIVVCTSEDRERHKNLQKIPVLVHSRECSTRELLV